MYTLFKYISGFVNTSLQSINSPLFIYSKCTYNDILYDGLSDRNIEYIPTINVYVSEVGGTCVPFAWMNAHHYVHQRCFWTSCTRAWTFHFSATLTWFRWISWIRDTLGNARHFRIIESRTPWTANIIFRCM